MHNFRTNQRIPDVNRGVFFQPAKPPSLSTHTVQVRKFKHYFAHLLPDILKKNEIDWPQETQQAVNITYRKVREGSDNPDQDIVYFDECTPKTKKLLYDIIEGNTDAVMAEFPLEESTSFDKLCEVYVHTEPGSRRRFTLLEHAAKSGNRPMLDHFYQIGLRYFCPSDQEIVDVTKRDPSGCTVLHWDVYCDQSRENIIGHQEQGYGVNDKNWDGKTPLYIAAEHGRTVCAEALLAAGADADRSYFDTEADHLHRERTPLSVAVEHGHTETIEALLAGKASITKPDGFSPLFMAAEHGHLGIVRLLLENNADVTATCRTNKRSLENFVTRKRRTADAKCKERMDLFIRNLPDREMIDLTVEDIAHIMGHDEIVTLIRINKLRVGEETTLTGEMSI